MFTYINKIVLHIYDLQPVFSVRPAADLIWRARMETIPVLTQRRCRRAGRDATPSDRGAKKTKFQVMWIYPAW